MSRSVSAPSSVTKTSPCWKGDIVPGSTLMYGSSLMQVTLSPLASSRQPMLEAASPFPRLDTTPPVTKMYLGIPSPFVSRPQTFLLRGAGLVALALLFLVVVVARLEVLLHLDCLGGLRVDELVERAQPRDRGAARRPLRLRDPPLVLLRRQGLPCLPQVRQADERPDDDERDDAEPDPVGHGCPPNISRTRRRSSSVSTPIDGDAASTTRIACPRSRTRSCSSDSARSSAVCGQRAYSNKKARRYT